MAAGKKRKTNSNGDNLRAAVRVAKCEVDWGSSVKDMNAKTREHYEATTKRWHAATRLVQEISNCFYDYWLAWHVLNQSDIKTKAWLDERQRVRDAMSGQPEKIINAALKEQVGPCPVETFPPDLMDSKRPTSFYRVLTIRFGELPAHIVSVILNGLQGKLTGKAAHGSLPKPTAMFLHHERVPNFTRPLPIPFVKQDCTLRKEGDEFYIDLKVWRVETTSKKGQPKMVCLTDSIKLRTKGAKCANERAMLSKIFTGEWEFKGSTLQWDDRCRKWLVNVCHQRPSHVMPVDPSKIAYLMAGCRNAFSVFYRDGKRWRRKWFQGRGLHIIEMRRKLWEYRAERNANYRHATARKGRGFDNANRWRATSAQTWKYFVRRVNHNLTAEVVKWCVVNWYGALVYKQPEGRYATSRFVAGEFKNSTWEFYQIGSQLAYKCQDAGIAFSVQKVGASADVATGVLGDARDSSDVTGSDATQINKIGRNAGRQQDRSRKAAGSMSRQ